MVLRKVVAPCAARDHTHTPNSHNNEQTQQLLPVPNPVTSYWLKDPHRYANLRSTPSLPKACGIAIIGSGMAGILTLYHILQQSAKEQTKSGKPIPNVVLLEARELCSGATARNGGHAKIKTATLTAIQDGEKRTEFQEYVHNVRQEIKAVVNTEGIECEFELRRSFDVFQDAGEYAKVKTVFNEALKAGEQWTERVSLVPEEYVEQVTSIRGAVGAFSVETASFWPYKLCTSLLEILVQRYPAHINVQTNTPVTSLSSTSEGQSILQTERGELRAGKVVLATNAYTAGLVPYFKKTIVPYKGMNSHHVPVKPVHPHLSHTYNIHFAPSPSGQPTGVDYLNPRPDGSVVVGGGKWFYDSPSQKHLWYNNFDDSATGRFPLDVEEYWEGYMQETFLGWENAGAKTDCVWVGIQAETPDELPHVGRVPGQEKQWMLAGFNGGGMGLISVAAKAVAKMVVEDTGFDEVKEEFGLLEGFATGEERMK
jgi:glycine/D-amino acid oxidase-like deaminating enzyme